MGYVIVGNKVYLIVGNKKYKITEIEGDAVHCRDEYGIEHAFPIH